MTMFSATVFSICFLIGTLSTAPTPPTLPSTRSNAAASSLPNNFLGQFGFLYQKLQDVCNKDELENCSGVEIQKVNFAINCTQVFYENMFCQAHNVLHQTQCGRKVSNVILSSLRGNQTNCGPSGTQDTGITLEDFCVDLNTTVRLMYRNC